MVVLFFSVNKVRVSGITGAILRPGFVDAGVQADFRVSVKSKK
jgi:hypothetical protein